MTPEEIKEITEYWKDIYTSPGSPIFVGKEYVFRLLAALEASQREADLLLNAFRHTHGNRQDGTDICKHCGLDLRHKIHSAQTEKAAEKSDQEGAG